MVSMPLAIICSGDGASPVWHQAITLANAAMLFVGPLGINFCEICIKIHQFSVYKTNLNENVFVKLLSIQPLCVNTLRPRQNGWHFPGDIFKFIFLNENVWFPIKISLKFVPKGPINNIPALVQIMSCGQPDNKPLSESMMVSLPMHICVTWPQWVKPFFDPFFLKDFSHEK